MRLRLIAALAGAAAVAGVAGAATLLASDGAPAPPVAPVIPPARTAPPPPAGALALARRSGRRVVALGLSRRAGSASAAITVLGAGGEPLDGLEVRLGGAGTAPCGHGCYGVVLPDNQLRRQLVVRVGRPGTPPASVVFRLPERWPAAANAVLRKAERALRGARSVTYRDRLESAPGQAVTTIWRVVAPDRLSYRTSDGSAGVIIGARRWDRASGSTRWLRSQQEPLALPALPWGSRVSNVQLLGRTESAIRIALYSPVTPAWYELTLDARTFRLRSLLMTAASHFMRDDYLAYGEVRGIEPPRA